MYFYICLVFIGAYWSGKKKKNYRPYVLTTSNNIVFIAKFVLVNTN